MTTPLRKVRKDDEWVIFEPAIESGDKGIQEAVNAVAEHPLVKAVLDSANVSMLMVNRDFQIVAANKALLRSLEKESADELIGKRLGDVVGCENALYAENGCGTSSNCNHCGATLSVITSQKTGETVDGECVLMADGKRGKAASEFSVRVTPVEIGKGYFSVIALRDISDTKRRRVLERIFIHDLKNTLTGLIGWSESLVEDPTDRVEEAAQSIRNLSMRLARETEDHRILMDVESNEFEPVLRLVCPTEIISSVEAIFSHHEVIDGKKLDSVEPVARVTLNTDPTLLTRVLTNMVKNAFEATPKGEVVRLGCESKNQSGSCRFFVWNDAKISGEVSKRVFQRSFSTKNGYGRGLGTYSMKLFGEQVLGGKVSFISTEEEGTTFYIELPVDDLMNTRIDEGLF